ncbi:HAMP domain-containing protein [bacterium]|nr:HAMP domain-containing protein [bacterium]
MIKLLRRSLVARVVLATCAMQLVLLTSLGGTIWLRVSALATEDFDRDLASTARHAFSGRPDAMMSLEQAERLFAVQADRQQVEEYFFAVQRRDPEGVLTYVSANWPKDLRLEDAAPSMTFPPDWYDLLEGRRPSSWPGRASGPVGGRRPPPGSGPPGNDGPPQGPSYRKDFRSEPGRTIEMADRAYRILTAGIPGEQMIIGADASRLEARKSAVLDAIFPALGGVALLSILSAVLLGRMVVAPVQRMTEELATISSDALHHRASPDNHVIEFSPIVNEFNAMMDRLRFSFERNGRFSATVAHQLKTPITVLVAQIEEALGRTRAGSEEEQRLAGFLEDLNRLREITDRVLLLSRAESGNLAILPESTNISNEVQGLIEDLGIIAPDLRIVDHIQPDIIIQADPALLYPAITNLLANAARHNDQRKKVEVELTSFDKLVRLRIRNTGPTIPTEEREQIFEHFRSRSTPEAAIEGGLGLGLPVAREIARLHGGEITLVSSTPQATEFEMTIPTRPPVQTRN